MAGGRTRTVTVEVTEERKGNAFKETAKDADGLEPKLRKAGSDGGEALGRGLSDGAGDGLDRIEGMFGDVFAGTALGNLAADAGSRIASGLTDAISTGLEQDAAGDKLAASLGMSPEESERAGRLAGELWSTGYGSGIEEVNAALRGVETNIGSLGDISDDELTSMAQDALNFAQVFDEDVNRATRGAGQLLRNGLAKDGEEAFDLLFAAAQKLPSEMGGELIDTIEEYSANWERLGLTGENAMAMILNGVESGARNTDLMADSLREFHDIMVEGTAEARQGLGLMGLDANAVFETIRAGGPMAESMMFQVLDALEGVADPSLRDQIGQSLFGVKWFDTGAEAILAMNDGTAALGDWRDASENAGQVADNLATQLDTLKRQALHGVTLGLEALFGILSKIPEPVRAVAVGIGGIAAVAGTGAFAIVKVADAVKSAGTWLTNLATPAGAVSGAFDSVGGSADRTTSKLGKVGRTLGAGLGIGGAVFGLMELSEALTSVELDAEDLAGMLANESDAGRASVQVSIEKLAAMGELGAAYDQILAQSPGLAEGFLEQAAAAGVEQATLDELRGKLEETREGQAANAEAQERWNAELEGGAERSALLGAAMDIVVGKLAGTNTALGQMSDGRSTVAAEQLAASFDTLANATASAEDKANAYRTALDALFGIQLGVGEANLRWHEQIAALNTTINEGTATLDLNTEAGRSNQSAFFGAAQAALGHADAIYRESGSLQSANDTLAGHIAQLRDDMVQTGLTEAQVDSYLDTLGLTPDAIGTTFAAYTANANGAVDGLQGNIARTPNLWNSAFGADTWQANREVDGLQQNIAATSGRTVTLNVRTQMDQLAFGWFAGGRALGGPVDMGRAYLVGEEGPELFMPNQAGRIIPNDDTMAALSASPAAGARGDGGLTVIVPVDARGAIGLDPAALGTVVKRAVNDGLANGDINVRGRRL